MSNLYGTRKRPKSPSSTPSSSTLAFTTTLSSLIAKDSSTPSSSGGGARPRPSKAAKSDLFARPNKGAAKRAAADGGEGADSSDEEEGDGGDAYLTRLRRKEREGLVDFDRKWADRAGSDEEREEEEEEEAGDDDNASIVSYEDELGRTRRGTRAEAARAAREKERAQRDGDDRVNQQERWRPSRPDNLIYGATVQTEAFQASGAMADLAARRDRSPTPPGAMHYDAEAEVRNRGTGFYAFSRDEEERRRQMEELMSARDETQREREARRARRAVRERARDERRKKVEELRSKRRAEMFLAGLGGPVGVME
ncbi:hypothetical protein ATEIFO6365_0004068300 [Aspergillus terreus]|uniref:Uncharacterized protein n=1 Tax=Aspergillus terreus TaxID=33178 RepID=A0A8H3R9X1_ASPTE|nr:hypothetical protein ATEIFO6365_0004068300 [Aspergillus terreus]